ncbi:hypothetical protein TIFTF001_027535 [Ficus carica]|uniref:Uncharacterized protein n=1 Tax=Ficus carica TaxID=3494 RepID=A0AA88DN73_FICCA|nr:hypothetical protein TIFTF001_027535 [Ficus carica]
MTITNLRPRDDNRHEHKSPASGRDSFFVDESAGGGNAVKI